jgi:hypothetical protein
MNLRKEIAPIMIRQENACNSFYEVIINRTNCTRAEAIKVLNTYIKLKIAKINVASGKVDIKHGIYLETDILLNAINNH